MQTPLFLDLEQVMRLHAGMIELYGGTEGTRDVGLLQSAMNDIQIEADEDGLVDLTLSGACGQSGKPEIAEFFRTRAH